VFGYIVKRILLMVPTFGAVSLIVFVVLNFAPGNPAQVALSSGDGKGGQSAQLSNQTRQSYRLFKEQFNLDKPVLLNTRFGLTTKRVRQTLDDLIKPAGDLSPARRSEAEDDIENWGSYAVPALIDIVKNDSDRTMRAFASQRLAVNTQRAVIVPSRGPLTSEQRAFNKAVAHENREAIKWAFTPADDAEREGAVVTFWSSWFEEHKERWTWDMGDKAKIFFTDTRFAKYWYNLAHLDFGISHVDQRPVLPKIIFKLRYTVSLSLSAILLVYLLSVPLGIWSAVARNSLSDRIVTVTLFMLYSLPNFFVGVFLLNLLSRGTPWAIFPTSGFQSLEVDHMTTLEYLKDILWHVILPIGCLSYAGLATLSRYARTGLLDVIRADYIRTARAKGLPESIVIIKHAARNGMIPILTLMATMLPALFGGSVVVEMVFGIPGIGSYMLQSIIARDYNVVMAVLLISCSLTLVGMLLSDLSYALVDPRITFD
jgi:peptide/nickel transport system permease protein